MSVLGPECFHLACNLELGDVVLIPHGYGVDKNNELTESSIKCLVKAAEMFQSIEKYRQGGLSGDNKDWLSENGRVMILLFSSEYFSTGFAFEDDLKRRLLINHGVNSDSIISSTRGINSTIQEIEFAVDFLKCKISDKRISKIRSICDSDHSARILKTWEHFMDDPNFSFGTAYAEFALSTLGQWSGRPEISTVLVDGVWDDNMPSWLQKRRWRWKLMNKLPLWLFLVMDKLKLHHKV